MTKILSRAGASLADIYDVEGSIAGIEQLETRELGIVHEMGATVFSERFSTRIIRITTGDIAQNTDFNIEEVNVSETPARLLGVQVFATVVSQTLRCAVLATDPILGQDFPLWVFDTAATNSDTVFLEDAAVHSNKQVLVPRIGIPVGPAFVGGREQQGTMASSVTLTGRTTGFGAGVVVHTALLLIAFARSDGSRSPPRGITIPSW